MQRQNMADPLYVPRVCEMAEANGVATRIQGNTLLFSKYGRLLAVDIVGEDPIFGYVEYGDYRFVITRLQQKV